MGMRVDIATLFPEMCQRVLDESILGRAARRGCIETHCHQIRDYTLNRQKQTDDYPYGGGCGKNLFHFIPPIFNIDFSPIIALIVLELVEQGLFFLLRILHTTLDLNLTGRLPVRFFSNF